MNPVCESPYPRCLLFARARAARVTARGNGAPGDAVRFFYSLRPHIATSHPATGFLRRVPSEQGGVEEGYDVLEDEAAKQEESPENAIVCAQCRYTITSTTQRIDVDGSHEHTFANPHGILFQIGCFQSAPGCSYVGPATAQWSWFEGYSWRIAVCSSCTSHLGWVFLPGEGTPFYGLILDRLVYPEGSWSPSRR